jgi:HYDIN/CFA65/VesB family protein
VPINGFMSSSASAHRRLLLAGLAAVLAAAVALPSTAGAVTSVAFDPTSVDFGLISPNGQQPRQTVQLRNTGTDPVTVNGFQTTGADPNAFFVDQSQCDGRILSPAGLAGDSCPVDVGFNPFDRRSFTAQVEATTMNNGPTATLALAGTAGHVALVAPPQDFGSSAVGEPGTTRLITATNEGNLEANLFVALITGPDIDAFQVIDETCTSAPVAPGGTCAVRVRFRPSAPGPRRARLALIGDDDANLRIDLSGVATVGRPSLVPAARDFGARTVGSTGPPVDFSFVNSGDGPVSVSSASVVGLDAARFALVRDDCTGAELAPGASCRLAARFTPGATGSAAASLRVVTTAGLAQAALSGRGRLAGTAILSWKRGTSVRLRGSKVTLGSATCSDADGCRLRIRALVTAPRRGGKASTAATTTKRLKTVSIVLRSGASRPLRLELSRTARALARRSGARLVAKVTVTASGATTVRTLAGRFANG